MNQDALLAEVIRIIDADRQDMVELCLALGNQTDYSGHEHAVGEVVIEWLRKAGIDAWLQNLSQTSVNAVGILRGAANGSGRGRSLVFNAHMDTQGVAPAVGGAEAEKQLRGAWVEGNLLFGQGLANDKAQLAAEMIAMRAIRKAGIRLEADLYVTGVAQETSAPLHGHVPIDKRSGIGPRFSQVGEGSGARWLVENGVVADFALVGEVSDFAVSVAQAGYVRLRIAVPGTVPYTPALSRGTSVAENINPFERAAHVIVAVESWARAYEKEQRKEFWGGTFVPKAQVYEVAGSGPAWTEAQDYCYVFVDVRLAPGADPVAIQNSLKRSVERATGLALEITPYDYKRGYVAEGSEPLLEALRQAHRRVLGRDLPFAGPVIHSMWRDANAFNEAGIPAIGYGPGTQDAGKGVSGRLAGVPRPISLDDLGATAKVFALTALTVCGVHSE